MIAESELRTRQTNYAFRGALAFGIPAFILFGAAGWNSLTDSESGIYFLAAAAVCGITGGIAYGPAVRRWAFPLILGIGFLFIEALFLMQDGHSTVLSKVVWTGLASAALFWTVGSCAALAIPAATRFDAGKAFAIPGGLAGMAFQFLYGPGRWLFRLDSEPWWGDSIWEHGLLWVIAGVGGGWILGSQLDRLHKRSTAGLTAPPLNRWAIASVISGSAGMVLSAMFLFRFRLPLGMPSGFSPATTAADWLWSWALLCTTIGAVAVIQTLRKPRSRNWTMIGIALTLSLIVLSYRFAADPLKSRFNTSYATVLLRGNGADAIYTGNLILAGVAADNGDNAAAGRYLINAADIPGLPLIAEKGPDTSVAASLIQRGERDAVLEYLNRCRKLWPAGGMVLDRWSNTIRQGRRPNFNNRNTAPPNQERTITGQPYTGGA
jgi:hypothetical protein